MQSILHGIGEILTPVLKDSKFRETGVLTPEEFVAAGDYLVFKCPTWSWESGSKDKIKSYLPADKQYLITRNVPCSKRVIRKKNDDGTLINNNETDDDVILEDGWISTNINQEDFIDDAEAEEEITDPSKNSASYNRKDINETSVVDSSDSELDENSIPDMDSYSCEDNVIQLPDQLNDPAEATNASSTNNSDTNSNILKTRSYDLFITYDKYYQTPRMWLFGYDESRNTLKPSEIFDDISQDHAKKTVTIESHPNLPLSMASIHPCKHAAVMKKLMDGMDTICKLRVDQYLILFLKFMSSVLPTIDYDYTMTMELK